MGVTSAVWWKSFGSEMKGVVFPGANWAVNAIPIGFTAVGWVVGNWVVEEKVRVSVGTWTIDVTIVYLVTFLLASLWLLGGLGYAIAKAKSAKIVLSDTLILDEGNHALRVGVRCEGRQAVSPELYAVRLWDSTGLPLEATAIAYHPLRWAHRDKGAKVELEAEGLPQAEVDVFYVKDGVLCLYDPPWHRPIDLGRSNDVGLSQIGVRVLAVASGCKPVEKDYCIEWGKNMAGYRPCTAESSGPPAGSSGQSG